MILARCRSLGFQLSSPSCPTLPYQPARSLATGKARQGSKIVPPQSQGGRGCLPRYATLPKGMDRMDGWGGVAPQPNPTHGWKKPFNFNSPSMSFIFRSASLRGGSTKYYYITTYVVAPTPTASSMEAWRGKTENERNRSGIYRTRMRIPPPSCCSGYLDRDRWIQTQRLSLTCVKYVTGR